ncbi:potassium channel family protein [Aeromicrobium sp. UC242_57]|uniref:potassium channel family protein n=1 Tax=Aeromicrobium sp. UC242_57 TaxID=3374624 RepID=UPI00379EF7FA
MDEARRLKWERLVDGPATASAIAFLAAYAWPILDPQLSDPLTAVCRWIVWVTWAMLVVDLTARLVLSEDRWAFLRRSPLDVAVVLLPLLRPLRLLRLVALLTVINRFAGNSMRGRVGDLVGSVTLIVFIASLAVLDAERGGSGSIQSFGDALWWSMTTITTVGYGDMFPVTTTGRLIAVGLMFSGIAVLGVVTASFASWLIEKVSEASDEAGAATARDIAALRLEVVALRESLSTARNDTAAHERDSSA